MTNVEKCPVPDPLTHHAHDDRFGNTTSAVVRPRTAVPSTGAGAVPDRRVAISRLATRRLCRLVLVMTVAHAAPGAAQTPDLAPYEKARAIVRDLDRIVAPSGIQESYKTPIGGIEQWVDVRGQDRANPVVLFIHGGPASPLMPTLWQFQRPIEEYFTVVNYDQRAAGKTFLETDPASIADTIHIARYVDDAIELAEYVRRRYHRRKLILMAHSWGTIIATQAALQRPDLFYGYVGIGQVVATRENERVSFDYAVDQAKLHANEEATKQLAAIAPYPGDQPITRERIVIARQWAQFYGGLSAFRESSPYFFDAPLLSPEYDAAQVAAIDAGNLFTLGRVLPEFLAVDFTRVTSFPIPIVLFMGRHDYTTPSAPTAAWLARLRAPSKRGVWFERSAHMIPWEEPGKMLVSLLAWVRPWAAGPVAQRVATHAPPR